MSKLKLLDIEVPAGASDGDLLRLVSGAWAAQAAAGADPGYLYAQTLSGASTSGTSFVNVLSLSLPASLSGDYLIQWAVRSNVNSAGGRPVIDIRTELDGGTDNVSWFESNSGSGTSSTWEFGERTYLGAFVATNLAATSGNTLLMRLRNGAAVGSVVVYTAALSFQKLP